MNLRQPGWQVRTDPAASTGNEVTDVLLTRQFQFLVQTMGRLSVKLSVKVLPELG
jgi:hypothetical protein